MTIQDRNGSVPDTIARIINEKGMKNKAVAERCGMNENQFSYLLTGRRLLTAVDITTIAKALDVTPNDLFADELPTSQSA